MDQRDRGALGVRYTRHFPEEVGLELDPQDGCETAEQRGGREKYQTGVDSISLISEAGMSIYRPEQEDSTAR